MKYDTTIEKVIPALDYPRNQPPNYFTKFDTGNQLNKFINPCNLNLLDRWQNRPWLH
jgi:hypothetical protein